MADEEKKPGFEIRDRRAGSEQEQDKESGSEAQEEKAEESQPQQAQARAQKEETKQPPPPLPQITFPAFLLSLNTSALIHMGLIPIPGTDQTEENLPLAKQNIDLLDLIKEKTRGNLTREEEDLLDNLLFDLKMKYVELTKSE
jgi:hypothetical protein